MESTEGKEGGEQGWLNEGGNRGKGWRARRAKAEEGVGVGGEHRGQGLGEHGGQGRSRARRARSVESTEGKEGGEHGGQAKTVESTVVNKGEEPGGLEGEERGWRTRRANGGGGL